MVATYVLHAHFIERITSVTVRVGWNRIHIHRIWPYIWWISCQLYRTYTAYIWYMVLANPALVASPLLPKTPQGFGGLLCFYSHKHTMRPLTPKTPRGSGGLLCFYSHEHTMRPLTPKTPRGSGGLLYFYSHEHTMRPLMPNTSQGSGLLIACTGTHTHSHTLTHTHSHTHTHTHTQHICHRRENTGAGSAYCCAGGRLCWHEAAIRSTAWGIWGQRGGATCTGESVCTSVCLYVHWWAV